MRKAGAMALKRILSMQDISCFGKCSQTVALPIISACGAECVVLPTAVLSTHTGGLGEVHFRDLSADVGPILAHWKSIGIAFDGIYIGYLGSKALVDCAKEVIALFRTPENFVLVDPVMGDHGRLYKRFDAAYAAEMAGLAALADYCVPNLTEAALLAGEEYPGELLQPKETAALLQRLGARYSKTRFVVTGVADGERTVGAATAGKPGRAGHSVHYAAARHDGRFHGTGDIFASVLAAALARGGSLRQAVEMSVDFTADTIERTIENGTDERFGVDFEEGLGALATRLANGIPDENANSE